MSLDYGIVGNCRSAALISQNGSVEWMCLPHFNSSSVFAKIIDTNKGGSFEIQVNEEYSIAQEYIYETNILSTIFSDGENSFEIIDFMPRYKDNNGLYNPPDLIRYVKLISGIPKFKILYNPQLEYAQYTTKHADEIEFIKSYTADGVYDSLYLYTSFNKTDILQGAEIELYEDGFFLTSYHQKLLQQTVYRQYLKMQRTLVYWLDWTNNLTKYTHYFEEIKRSALVLKLLSYDKTGAIIAAATTSIPETIGEERNWDYRFCWIRDASMVIKVMTSIGQKNMVKRFINFIIDIIPEKDEKMQIMYGIHGEKILHETILSHLDGYQNSKPVRIGNAAYAQAQHDIFGILMDVIYQQFELFKVSLENSETLWTITRSIVKTVDENWKNPDKGIWEIRSDEKHFTFSKVLCWVAIDRSIKIAQIISKDDYANKWQFLADSIKQDILIHAWNSEKQAYAQCYGSSDLDASVLLMQKYGFIEAKDQRYISTVKAIKKELMQDGLMYRYKNKDDFGLPSSSFTICTFWLIQSLYEIGERKEAVDLFESVLSYANYLGIYSEDIDFKSKVLLGNFPQAYSHLALIETAIIISQGNMQNDEQIIQAIEKYTPTH